MKLSSLLSCLLIVIMMSGCGQVVYRVKTDSPAKMGIEEARDALELGLSLAKKPPGVESITWQGDEVVIFNPMRGGSTMTMKRCTADCDDISKKVVKIGNGFSVDVFTKSVHARYSETLTWKSEEDARLFVDAAHALCQAKYRKDPDKTEIATLPSASPQTDVPRQPPIQTEPAKKRESITTDLAKATTTPTPPSDSASPKSPSIVLIEKTPPKMAVTSPAPKIDVPPQPPKQTETTKKRETISPELAKVKTPPPPSSDSAPPKPSSIASAEKVPPKITITSPNITRNGSVIARRSNMPVTGMVESKAGLADVLINGQPVDVDEKGNFSGDVFLKVGKNNITVTAIDVLKNKVTKQFVINRERVQTAAISQSDASAPKIMIVSPDVTRAVSLVAKKSSITVIGIIESEIGVADILINGQQADLDEKGNFSADVLLNVGKNDITVTAIDVRRNQVTKQFVINRDAGKVAAAKKEEPVPETGFTSGKYHALLIAVQDYANPEIGKLDYPVSDTRQLMEVLSSRYNFEKENIKILNNPDRRTIYKTLQDLRKQLTGKDNLLIFYAGHGMWLDDMKQGFWLPRDAAGLNDPSDWIPNSTIRDYIKAIKAKHILLVADACFSGGIFKLREASSSPGISVEKIYELPSRKAMTSGSLKTVPDQSVFVEFLIRRLKENNEPYLDAQKLFARLREAVINNSKVNQTPLYGAINETGDEGGDFVFVRRQ